MDTPVRVVDKTRSDHLAATRAFLYVWLAAILETYVKSEIKAVFAHIASQQVPISRLKDNWWSLTANSLFRSISDVKKYRDKWDKRIELFDHTKDSTPASFDSDCIPLDGKTLRAYHFSTLWKIFEFQPPYLPSPTHGLALEDLADGRNDVAHGNIEPITFGKTKTTLDVLSMAGKVEDIVTHFAAAKERCLNAQAYVR